jgi:glutathione S-transferase
MLKIYGHPLSTCTRKVLTTVAELDMPHELVLIDFAKGEHKQEPHLSRQPFGRIPAIDHDGFEMFESRAICRYLDAVDGKHKLVPADLHAAAKMEQWISVETSEFTANAMKFVYHHIFQRKQDDAVLESAGKALEHTLNIMEKALTSQLYFAGSQFSLADISYMPYVEYTINTPVKETYARFPAVLAWWTRVSERPSWRKVAGRA